MNENYFYVILFSCMIDIQTYKAHWSGLLSYNASLLSVMQSMQITQSVYIIKIQKHFCVWSLPIHFTDPVWEFSRLVWELTIDRKCGHEVHILTIFWIWFFNSFVSTEITRELTMRRQSTFVKSHLSNPLFKNSSLIWVVIIYLPFFSCFQLVSFH